MKNAKIMNPKILKPGNVYRLRILDDIDQKIIDYELITEVLRIEDGLNDPDYPEDPDNIVIFFSDLVTIKVPDVKFDNEPTIWDLEYGGLSEHEKACYLIEDLGHKSEHPEYFL